MIRLFIFFFICISFCFDSVYQYQSNAKEIELPVFSNVQKEAGIPFVGNIGQVATFGDYNVDGWQDLFLSNSDRSNRRNMRLQINDDSKKTKKVNSKSRLIKQVFLILDIKVQHGLTIIMMAYQIYY